MPKMILIYLQNMESQELRYCLNPNCSQQQQRVFLREHSDGLHFDCKSWVIAQHQIADLSFHKVPFSVDALLEFASRPIETQAYIHFNRQSITGFLVQFLETIRSDIENILKELQRQLHDFLENLLSFNKYEEIHLLSKQQGVAADLKSLKLSQLLKAPLPLYHDFTLPSPKTSALIASNLRNDIQNLINFQTIKVAEHYEHIKRKQRGLHSDQTKMESIEPEESYFGNQEKCLSRKKDLSKVQDELGELWEYILKNCNLNTATRLMGEPLQRFYQHQSEGKQSSVKCCYCSFRVKLKTRSKAQTNSACSYAILEHLYKEHTSSVLYQYSILKGSFSSNSFHLLLQKIANHKMQSVTIIDTSSLFNIKKLLLENDSFAFEIIFGRNKPLFKNEFMRGGNPKEIMILLGLLVSYASILCKKRVIVYTSDQKSQTINKACRFYGLENVTAVSGTASTDNGVEVLKKSKQTPSTKILHDL